VSGASIGTAAVTPDCRPQTVCRVCRCITLTALSILHNENPVNRRIIWSCTLIGLGASPLFFSVSAQPYFWTDIAEIAERQLVSADYRALLAAVLRGIPGAYYRPVVFIAHTINYSLWGDSPYAFRLTNVLLHITNALLVFWCVSKIDVRNALATALLFVVHPLALTPAVWISDRSDVMALLFCLLTVVGSLHYCAAERKRWLLSSAACMGFALAAKESAAALVLLSAAFCCVNGFRRSTVLLATTHAAIACAFLWWRFYVVGSLATTSRDLGFAKTIAVAAYVHIQYIGQMLQPWSLQLCDGMRVPALAWIAPGCAILVVLAWAVHRAYARQNWPVLSGLLWLLAFMLPTSGVLALKHVRADRYLYLALPAILYLFICLGRALAQRIIPSKIYGRWVGIGIFAAFVAFHITSTIVRGGHFGSERTIWEWELAQNDACMEAHAHLSRLDFSENRMRPALWHSDQLVAAHPEAIIAYAPIDQHMIYRGLILSDMENYSAAVRAYDNVITSTHDSSLRAEAFYGLGLIAINTERFSEAIDAFNNAATSARMASIPDIILFRGLAYLQQGNREQAREDFKRYLVVMPRRLSAGRASIVHMLRDALE